VTRSTVEQVSDFLDEQERQRQKRMAAAGEK
jgi:hypothetical protein